MNRLTRKTTKKDFVSKESCYYLYEDEDTKEKFLKKYPYAADQWPRWIDINAYISKLGRLEDLEEELGCPLEVVLEALKNGFYCVDNDNQVIRNFKAPLCFNSTSKEFYWSGNNIGYPDLKDYGKTWFLKGEKCD